MREILWDFCQAMDLAGRYFSFNSLTQHADEPLADCDHDGCQRGAWAFFDWCRS